MNSGIAHGSINNNGAISGRKNANSMRVPGNMKNNRANSNAAIDNSQVSNDLSAVYTA